jgi:hypothetical protein
MFNVVTILAVIALLLAIWSALGKPTLWIAVVLLSVIELLRSAAPFVR